MNFKYGSCLGLALVLFAGLAAAADPVPLDGLAYRLVGPFRGGRVTGVAGVAGDPGVYYFGAAAGGLWKTTDGGVSWKPLWDHFPEASPAIGAVAVAPSDPKTLYVGTGEVNIRGDVVTGNGLYKSADAGKTWRFSGLRDSQAIGRIVVDPKDPNVLFVAALGHPFGENDERGVFKSTDGGASWRKVLFVDARTGASDVRFDPSNPKVLYAGMWQVYRKPWIMESGGPGSGLYKSVDGGEHWIRLTGGGLPEGVLGRINVAPTSDPNRVYAMIEAGRGGLYRTDDGGKSWALINDKNDYRQRAWYFNTVFADPKAPDTVYVLNTQAYRSTDAGKTFKPLHTRHGDTHELWIDPSDPRRMINGNDGGANITVDGAETWSSQMNQPTAQFYHIDADDDLPFRLYGAQQDNSTVAIATAGRSGGVGIEDWYDVGGGESGFVVPDPTDPQIVYASGYGGEITRYDHRTNVTRQITPWPRNTMGWAPEALQYRFQWTAPILVSRHAPHAVYFAAQVLFRSTDKGQSWAVISPDLTHDDKSRQQPSGGPITKDNTSVETFGTIFALAESPTQAGLLWVGSDDGLVHLSRDDGGHWRDVTPGTMPASATVDAIETDARDGAVAYVAADRHRLDDFAPYAWRTRDFGAHWTSISTGLPADAYVHVVRTDPERKGLLYVGTERGVFVSYDDGDNWRPLQLNLPVAPVHDLIVHGSSLGVATHGRAFWVLDDLSAVRQWSPQIPGETAHLFRPAPANHTVFRTRATDLRDGGAANPPAGAVISYYLSASLGSPRPAEGVDDKEKDKEKKEKAPDPLAKRIRLEILDADGHVVRTFPDPRAAPKEAQSESKSAPKSQPEPDAEVSEEEGGPPPPPKLPHLAGFNSFVWDLRYEGATPIPRAPLWAGNVAGPKATPGHYQVRLTVDGASQTQPLEILADRGVAASPAQLARQFELHRQIDAELSAVDEAVLAIRATRARVEAVGHEAAEHGASGSPRAAALSSAGERLNQRMTAIEEVLIQPRAHASEDALNYPIQLNNMLAALASQVGSGDAEPTLQDEQVFADLKARADAQLAAWKALQTTEVAAFERMSEPAGAPTGANGAYRSR
jgi:photosystem II stability/assembly factor-like uncharacterized protein